MKIAMIENSVSLCKNKTKPQMVSNQLIQAVNNGGLSPHSQDSGHEADSANRMASRDLMEVGKTAEITLLWRQGGQCTIRNMQGV